MASLRLAVVIPALLFLSDSVPDESRIYVVAAYIVGGLHVWASKLAKRRGEHI